MERTKLFQILCKELSGTYAAIGTCWGGFAEFLQQNTALTKLYCIDPYRVFPQSVYYDALNFTTQEFLDKKFETVCQRLLKHKNTVMVRSTSYEAAQQLENDFAFVYIDANHHHKEVLKDLVIWWPKIRSGGILAGDDVEDINEKHTDGDLFIKREGSFGVYGVATALKDFANVCPDFKYTIVGNQFYAIKN